MKHTQWNIASQPNKGLRITDLNPGDYFCPSNTRSIYMMLSEGRHVNETGILMVDKYEDREVFLVHPSHIDGDGNIVFKVDNGKGE